MGCGASKATQVEPVGIGAGSSDQRNGGGDANTDKPWKVAKNQVAPLPPGHPEDGEVHLKTSGGKKADTSRGSAKLRLMSLPEALPSDLKAICSQAIPGTDLHTLAEQLQSILRSLPAFLRTNAHVSKLPILQACAADARACISSVLDPVLAHMDRTLSGKQATSALTAEVTSWEELQFPDLLHVLECACNSVYEMGVMEVGRPAALLLDVLTQLQDHCKERGLPLEASDLRVPCICELMSMVGVVFFRKVVLETPDSAKARIEDYHQLRDQLGWNDEHLVTCLDPRAKAMLLYLDQVATAGERRGNFTVRRSAVLWDALATPTAGNLPRSAAGAATVSVKIFPSFVDEYAKATKPGKKVVVEAGEGHGPRKEFFLLAGQAMAGMRPASSDTQPPGTDPFEPDDDPEHPPLFMFNRGAGFYWYNTGLEDSLKLRNAFTFAGWLMGQCILNRAPLGLRLPPLMFRALLEGVDFKPSLADLQRYDPEAAQSIRNVASLPAGQLRDMLEMEGLPRTTTAEAYIGHCVRTLIVDSVAWQAASLARGFGLTLDRRALRTWQLGPEELAALVAGASSGCGGAGGADASTEVHIRKLFRVVMDEELTNKSGVLGELLWEVLGKWSAAERLKFVEFVTGTPRLPLPGSELLKVQAPFVAMGLSEHKTTLGMLPQAHTCDNLLELPNYWESLLVTKGLAKAGGISAPTLTPAQEAEVRKECAAVLDDRLRLAVTAFSGYGLDERERDEGDDEAEEEEALRQSMHSDLSPTSPVPLTASSLASLRQHSAQMGPPGPIFEAVELHDSCHTHSHTGQPGQVALPGVSSQRPAPSVAPVALPGPAALSQMPGGATESFRMPGLDLDPAMHAEVAMLYVTPRNAHRVAEAEAARSAAAATSHAGTAASNMPPPRYDSAGSVTLQQAPRPECPPAPTRLVLTGSGAQAGQQGGAAGATRDPREVSCASPGLVLRADTLDVLANQLSAGMDMDGALRGGGAGGGGRVSDVSSLPPMDASRRVLLEQLAAAPPSMLELLPGPLQQLMAAEGGALEQLKHATQSGQMQLPDSQAVPRPSLDKGDGVQILRLEPSSDRFDQMQLRLTAASTGMTAATVTTAGSGIRVMGSGPGGAVSGPLPEAVLSHGFTGLSDLAPPSATGTGMA